MSDIDSFRKEINRIDEELLRLFVKRMNVAARIGIAKRAADLPIYVRERENEVLERILKKMSDGSLSAEVTGFFQKLMEISRSVQTGLVFRNIILTGMPGCGKTEIGRLVADRLGLRFIDLDAWIEEKEGRSVKEIFDKGEGVFRAIETEALRACAPTPWCVLSTGGGAVLLPGNVETMRASGDVYFIDRPPELIVRDLDISKRPLLADGRHVLFEIHGKRYETYKATCDFRILNNGTLEEAADAVIEAAAGAAVARASRPACQT